MIRTASSLRWVLFTLLIVRPLSADAGGVRLVESDVANNGSRISAVSPDGAHVYVTGGQADEIWVYATSGNGIDDTLVQTVTGAEDATAIAISPDGAHVYVSSRQGSGELQVYSRAIDGTLTLLETQVDNANGVPDHTMRKPQGVVVSPDGAHVYVVTFADDSIVVFTRDDDDMSAGFGKLTFLEVQQQSPGSCDMGGVCGLGDARTMAFSPDGKSLYAGGKKGDAKAGVIAVFTRDDDSMSANYGKLTFEQRILNLENGITQLHRPETLAVSPDGAHLYSASGGGDAVHVFARGPSGTLTVVEFQKDGGNTNGLAGASGLAIDPAGLYVYVAAAGDNAISVFRRNPSTGKLAIIETRANGAGLPVGTLGGPRDAHLSPDGTHLYVVNTTDVIVSFVVDVCGDDIRGPDQQCDDPAPAENGDGCSATCRLEVCDTPATGCSLTHIAAAESAALTIKNDPLLADSKDQLQWKFSLGTVALGGFGDPRLDDPAYDSYVLCVYDGNDVLLMSNVAPKGGPTFGCKKGDHCWKTSPAPKPTVAPGNVKQYKYGDNSLTPDGLQQVQLKTGIGNAKLQLKGKGSNLAPPVLPGGGLTLPVKAIMKSTGSGICWSSTFDNSLPLEERIIQNDGVRFRAKNTN